MGRAQGRLRGASRLPPCCRDPAPKEGTRRYGADRAGIEHRQRLQEVLGQVRVLARFLGKSLSESNSRRLRSGRARGALQPAHDGSSRPSCPEASPQARPFRAIAKSASASAASSSGLLRVLAACAASPLRGGPMAPAAVSGTPGDNRPPDVASRTWKLGATCPAKGPACPKPAWVLKTEGRASVPSASACWNSLFSARNQVATCTHHLTVIGRYRT